MFGSMLFAFGSAMNIDAMSNFNSLNEDKTACSSIDNPTADVALRDELQGRVTHELFKLETVHDLNPVGMIFRLFAAGLPPELDDMLADDLEFDWEALPKSLNTKSIDQLNAILDECNAIKSCESKSEAKSKLKTLLTSIGLTR